MEPRHHQPSTEQAPVSLCQLLVGNPLSPGLGDASGFEGEESSSRARTWDGWVGAYRRKKEESELARLS